VSYDNTSASIAPRFLVNFAGALGNSEVGLISASGSSLQHASVTPRPVTAGRTPRGESQIVTLTKPTDDGNFTLSLTHNSNTYTTSAIAFDATTADVQSAIAAAISPITGATAAVTYFNGTEIHITFAGTLSGVDLANITGMVIGNVVPAGLSQTVEGFDRPEVPAVNETLVVDYAADPLTIPSGPGKTFTFTMNGQLGELTEASGHLSGTLASFANVSGDFSFRRTLKEGVARLVVGASGVTAFVGNSFGTADAKGFQISSGKLGLIVLQQSAGSDALWAMTAGGTAEIVGISGLTARGSLDLRINRFGAEIDETVATPGGNVRVQFTSADSVTQVYGSATLVTPISELTGDFTIEATGIAPNRELLLGAANVSAFVGDTKGTAATGDDIGVRFSGGSLIGYIAPNSTYAFDASGAASLVGISDLTLTGTLSAQKNTTGANVNRTITVAGSSRTLNVAAGASRVGGNVTLITPVANLSADFAVETTGTSPNQEILFAADNVSTFVGDTKGTAATGDDIGVRFSGGSLIGYIAPNSTYAFDASGAASLVGISDLTLTGTLSAQKNTTGANVNRTITVAGSSRTLNVAAGASRVGGNVTLITPVANLSADFAVETTGTSPNQEILFAADNVSTFVGDTKGTAATGDDIGVRFSGGSLIGYIAPNSTYAFDASGAASLVGISDLTLTGTLSAQKNTTGANVNRTITVAGSSRTLNVAAGASRVGGNVTLIT
ncbi:MAG: beta strand repeat-containing protein, partial [Planctomycetaceae bacterium]